MNIRFTGMLAAVLIASVASNAGAVSYSGDQGARIQGGSVPPDRSVVNNVNDGNASTFYALGIGGTLTADLSPLSVGSASVVEVTFSTINPLFPESAEVWLGGSVSGSGVFDPTGAVLLGELFNNQAPTSAGAGVGTITLTQQGGNTSTWTIDPDAPVVYSLITLVDTTAVNFAADYAASGLDNDGFDVGEFSVQAVQAVPLPASILMLMGAMSGLGFIGWRRKTTA